MNPESFEPLLRAFAEKYPVVANELARLRPPPKSVITRAIEPPPLTQLTVAVAGACLSIPGNHYIHLYSREADIRPELLRMALLSIEADPKAELLVNTRRTRALIRAVQSVRPKEHTLKRIHRQASSAALFEYKPYEKSGFTVALIDLDFLSKETSFDVLRSIRGQHSENRIIVFGSRIHPLLPAFVSDQQRNPGNVLWGVNRQQILEVDRGANQLALRRIEELSTGGFDASQIPEHFHDVDVKSLIPGQFRTGAFITRFWSAIAGYYTIRDAERRTTQKRQVVRVPGVAAPTLPTARDRITDLVGRLDSASNSFSVENAIRTLSYLLQLLDQTASSLRTYLEKAQADGVNFVARPYDELARLEHFECKGFDDFVGPIRLAAEDLRRAYDAILEAGGMPPRVKILGKLVNEAAAAGKRIVVLCFNKADRLASTHDLKSMLQPIPPKSSAAIAFEELRFLESGAEFDEGFLLRIPSQELLDRAAASKISSLTLVVPEGQEERVTRRMFQDVSRERRVFSAPNQRHVLQTLGIKGEFLPASMDVLPPIDPATDELLARPNRSKPQLDLTELAERIYDAPQPEKNRETENEASSITPLGPPWTIWFDDDSVERMSSTEHAQVLDLKTDRWEPVLASRLKVGDVLVTTNDSSSSAKFGRAIRQLLASLDAKFRTDLVLDNLWRDSITRYKAERKLTWGDLYEECRKNGYSNRRDENLFHYSARNTWLPLNESLFSAVLRTTAPASHGLDHMVEMCWKATDHLHSAAKQIYSYIRRTAAETLDFARILEDKTHDDDDVDPVIIKELGLRASQVEEMFSVRRVARIIPPLQEQPRATSQTRTV